ncbi:MAG: hypothetical protein WA626_04200, partial [Acidobacteriaceae bacterium]
TRAVILFCHLLVVLPLLGSARKSTDVIVMQNGDRFTGEVKALDAGVLYVSLPYVIQTLSVDWLKVARLESKQLFLVRTENGTVYKGGAQQPRNRRWPAHRDRDSGNSREEGCDQQHTNRQRFPDL